MKYKNYYLFSSEHVRNNISNYEKKTKYFNVKLHVSDQKTEEYRKILDTNLLAPAIFSREAVLSMKKRDSQGHIINISR